MVFIFDSIPANLSNYDVIFILFCHSVGSLTYLKFFLYLLAAATSTVIKHKNLFISITFICGRIVKIYTLINFRYFCLITVNDFLQLPAFWSPLLLLTFGNIPSLSNKIA